MIRYHHAGCAQSCLGGGTARSLLLQAVWLHKPIGPRRTSCSRERNEVYLFVQSATCPNYNPQIQRSHRTKPFAARSVQPAAKIHRGRVPLQRHSRFRQTSRLALDEIRQSGEGTLRETADADAPRLLPTCTEKLSPAVRAVLRYNTQSLPVPRRAGSTRRRPANNCCIVVTHRLQVSAVNLDITRKFAGRPGCWAAHPLASTNPIDGTCNQHDLDHREGARIQAKRAVVVPDPSRCSRGGVVVATPVPVRCTSKRTCRKP